MTPAGASDGNSPPVRMSVQAQVVVPSFLLVPLADLIIAGAQDRRTRKTNLILYRGDPVKHMRLKGATKAGRLGRGAVNG